MKLTERINNFDLSTLSGGQRIIIALAFVWLAACALFVFSNIQTKRELDRKLMEEVATIQVSNASPELKVELVKNVHESYAKNLRAVPTVFIWACGKVVIAWLAGVGTLLTLYSLLLWIARGFHRSAEGS